MKAKLFSTESLLISLKAIGTSIVTSLVFLILIVSFRYIKNTLQLPMLAIIIGLLTIMGYLFTWGYFARKFWGWK